MLRAGRIVGSLSEQLDRVFHREIAGTEMRHQQGKRAHHEEDTRALVAELITLNVFEHVPGRKHKSIPNFQRNVSLWKPGNLKSRLQSHSRELDNIRDIVCSAEVNLGF